MKRVKVIASQVCAQPGAGVEASSWKIKGIVYRRIEADCDPELLFQFNKKHGSTPHNFIPDGPVREHFGKIATGETIVWGAFQDAELVGLISSEVGGGYWLQTGHGEKAVSFINEFVVNPELRGRNIGQNLTKISVDPVLGIFGIKPNIKEQYTTFHQNNIGSRTAFMKGAGYTEVCTYEDAFRKRNTTVAKYAPTRNIVPQDPPDMLQVNQEGKSWTVKGIKYRLIERTYDSKALFQFNKTHGSTPHNFIPDGPVREHLGKIATGETMVWGAFSGGELVGFISGECGGGYWSETGAGDNVCFIHEFVVNPGYRGKSIGKYLTKISVDASLGIFGIIPAVREMYTTFHIDNMGSRTSFIKGGGYREVMTYADPFRDRRTTVAKYSVYTAMAPRLRCTATGVRVDPSVQLGFASPHKDPVDACHVLMPVIDETWWQSQPKPAVTGDSNPFNHFRDRLFSYRLALSLGLSDAEYVSIVHELDEGLRRVEPRGPGGFKRTPLEFQRELNVWGKDESGQIGQSHKARHLAAIMIYLQVLLRSGAPAAKGLRERVLSVASCGNAALAAATVAAAASWPILVFVPDDAEPVVLDRLRELGAKVEICPKADNAKFGGDATVHHFRRSVENGAIPFSVQATDNGLAAEGSSTLVWEALEQLKEHGVDNFGSIVVQVGGGALASGIFSGLEYAEANGLISSLPVFHTVQGEGCAPLRKCADQLSSKLAEPRSKERVQGLLAEACKTERSFMEVWPNPSGLAHGIQDDETYDWLKVCEGMLRTGGSVKVVSDAHVQQAWDEARKASGSDLCATGCSGFAGVLRMRSEGVALQDPVLCVFSGKDRH